MSATELMIFSPVRSLLWGVAAGLSNRNVMSGTPLRARFPGEDCERFRRRN